MIKGLFGSKTKSEKEQQPVLNKKRVEDTQGSSPKDVFKYYESNFLADERLQALDENEKKEVIGRFYDKFGMQYMSEIGITDKNKINEFRTKYIEDIYKRMTEPPKKKESPEQEALRKPGEVFGSMYKEWSEIKKMEETEKGEELNKRIDQSVQEAISHGVMPQRIINVLENQTVSTEDKKFQIVGAIRLQNPEVKGTQVLKLANEITDTYNEFLLNRRKAKSDDEYQQMYANTYSRINQLLQENNLPPININERGIITEADYPGLAIPSPIEGKPSLFGMQQTPKTPEEEERPSFPARAGGAFAKGSAALGQGLARMPAFTLDLLYAPQNLIAEVTGWDWLQAQPPEWLKNNPVAKYYDEQVQAWDEKMQLGDLKIVDSFKEGDIKDGFENIALMVAETLPLTISLMAGGFAQAGTGANILTQTARTATPIGMYAGAQKKHELDKNYPTLSEFTKTYNALMTGVGEGLSESLGTISIGRLGRDLMQSMGKESFEKTLKGSAIEMLYKRLGKSYILTGAIGEGTEEVVAGVIENLTDKFTGADPDRKIFEGTADQFIVGFFSGGVVTTPIELANRAAKITEKDMYKEYINKMYDKYTTPQDVEGQKLPPDIVPPKEEKPETPPKKEEPKAETQPEVKPEEKPQPELKKGAKLSYKGLDVIADKITPDEVIIYPEGGNSIQDAIYVPKEEIGTELVPREEIPKEIKGLKVIEESAPTPDGERVFRVEGDRFLTLDGKELRVDMALEKETKKPPQPEKKPEEKREQPEQKPEVKPQKTPPEVKKEEKPSMRSIRELEKLNISQMTFDEFLKLKGAQGAYNGSQAERDNYKKLYDTNIEKSKKQIKPIKKEKKKRETPKRIKKVLSNDPQSIRESILQYFVKGGRVKTSSFKIGLKGKGRELSSKAMHFLSEKRGVPVDTLYEQFQDTFGAENLQGMDFPNMVYDVINQHSSIWSMVKELEKLHEGMEKGAEAQVPIDEDTEVILEDAVIDQETFFENPEVESMLTDFIKNNEVDFDALNTQLEKDPDSFFLYDISKDELKELQNFIKDENNRQQIREYFKEYKGIIPEQLSEEYDSPKVGDQESIKKEQGETKPKLTETQQKDLDKKLKDIDEELESRDTELREARHDREVQFSKIRERNGLFGDTKADQGTLIEGKFVYTEETVKKALKPFDERIYKIEKEIEKLEKLRDDTIKFADQQGDLFAPPEGEEPDVRLRVVSISNGTDGARRRSPLGLYSTVQKAIDGLKQAKGTPQQMKAMLLAGGAKQAELDWYEFDKFSQDKKSLTKDEIQEWFDSRKIEVREVVKGKVDREDLEMVKVEPFIYNVVNKQGDVVLERVSEQRAIDFIENNYDGTDTKFSQWQLPGGENYREVLLAMPSEKGLNAIELEEFNKLQMTPVTYMSEGQKQREKYLRDKAQGFTDFKSSHFEEPNIVVHIRVNDRMTKDGKKILFLEELQSDWAQKGKKEGFAVKRKVPSRQELRVLYNGETLYNKKNYIVSYENENGQISTISEYAAINEEDAKDQALIDIKNNESFNRVKVPDMPFKKTGQWIGLAMKRMLIYAAENGYDGISWTTGEQQADRYDLSKQVDYIQAEPSTMRGDSNRIYVSISTTNSIINLYVDKTTGKVTEQTGDTRFDDVVGKGLDEVIGKEISEKVLAVKTQQKFSGNDLKVGGKGMEAFYDQIIPSWVNKNLKKYGIQSGETDISQKRFKIRLKNNGFYEISDIDGNIVMNNVDSEKIDQWRQSETKVHFIPVTDQIRGLIPEGMPMFRLMEKSVKTDEKGRKTVSKHGLSNKELTGIRDKLRTLAMQAGANIKIADKQSELPKPLQKKIGNKPVYGVHSAGQTWFIMENMPSMEEAVLTFMHEVGVHAGITKLIPDEFERAQFFNQLVDDIGLDRIREVVGDEFVDAYLDGNIDKHVIGEEFMAYLADQKLDPNTTLSKKEQSWWKKFIDKINEFLTRVFNFETKITEADVLKIAEAAIQANYQSKETIDTTSQIPQQQRIPFASELLITDDVYLRRVPKEKSITEVDSEIKPDTSKRIEKGWFDSFLRRGITNNMIAVQRFQEKILELGGKIRDLADIHSMENLFHSRVAEMIADYDRLLIKPYTKAVAEFQKAGNLTAQERIKYMHCKHTPERTETFINREIEKIRQKFEEDPTQLGLDIEAGEQELNDYIDVMREEMKNNVYTGYSVAEAEEYVNEIEGRIKDKKVIDDLWETTNKISKAICDNWYTYDRINGEAYDEIVSRWKYYVPLRGWEVDETTGVFEYEKLSGEYINSFVPMKGRISKPDDPQPYLISMLFNSLIEGERNEISKAAGRLVNDNLDVLGDLAGGTVVYNVDTGKKNPDGTVAWDEWIERPPQEYFDRRKVKVAKHNPTKQRKPPTHAREHLVQFWLDGHKYALWFQDNAIAKGINNIHGRELARSLGWLTSGWSFKLHSFPTLSGKRDVIVKIPGLGNITRFMSQNFTARNLNFLVINPVRDIPLAALTQFVEGTAMDAPKMLAYLAKAQPVIYRSIKGKLDMNNKYDKMFEDWRLGGGRTGIVRNLDIDTIRKRLEGNIKKYTKDTSTGEKIVTAPWELVKDIAEIFETLSGWSEDMTRFAVYMQAIESGKSQQRALIDSKNSSVNFNKKGEWTPILGSIYAFFNAQVQGVVKIGQLHKTDWKKMVAIEGWLIAQGFLMAALYDIFGDGDDEDDGSGLSAYDKLFDHEKYNNLHIPGTKLKVPMPHILRWFNALGMIVYDAVRNVHLGRKESGDAIVDAMLMALSEFPQDMSPWDFGGFINKEGKFTIRPFVPTAGIPFYDLAVNEDWTKRKIYKEPYTKEEAKYLAKSQAYFKGTNTALVKFTDAWYKMFGGEIETGYRYYFDEDRKEMRKVPFFGDLNPAWLETTAEGYFGGMGTFFNDVWQLGGGIIKSATEAMGEKQFKEAVKDNISMTDVPMVQRFISRPYRDIKQEYWIQEREVLTAYKKLYKRYVKVTNFAKAEEMRSVFTYERMMLFEGMENYIKALDDKIYEETDKEQIKKLRKAKNEVIDKYTDYIDQITDEIKNIQDR